MAENAAHMVQIRYFAWVREKVGLETEDVELPANIATVADLVGWLKPRGPQYGEAVARPAGRRAALAARGGWLRGVGPQCGEAFARPQVVRAALDKVHVKPTAALGTAREIAFFPPV